MRMPPLGANHFNDEMPVGGDSTSVAGVNGCGGVELFDDGWANDLLAALISALIDLGSSGTFRVEVNQRSS